jgi:hypothetical protein
MAEVTAAAIMTAHNRLMLIASCFRIGGKDCERIVARQRSRIKAFSGAKKGRGVFGIRRKGKTGSS